MGIFTLCLTVLPLGAPALVQLEKHILACVHLSMVISLSMGRRPRHGRNKVSVLPSWPFYCVLVCVNEKAHHPETPHCTFTSENAAVCSVSKIQLSLLCILALMGRKRTFEVFSNKPFNNQTLRNVCGYRCTKKIKKK